MFKSVYALILAALLGMALSCVAENAEGVQFSDEQVDAVAGLLDTVYDGKFDDSLVERDDKASATARRPKFSFLGQGFLGIYSIGVAQRLTELRVLRRDSHMFAASSGGLFAGAYCSGATFRNMIDEIRNLITTCANQPPFYCFSQIASKNLAIFKKIIPPARRGRGYPNCRNTVMSVSESSGTCNYFATPPDMGVTGRASFISGFRNKGELIDAMLATSYIPGFSAPECFVTLRGERVADGGFVANSFCPPGNCVRVYVYPPTPQRPVDIYPGIRNGSLASWPFNAQQWQDASLRPFLVAPHYDTILAFGRADAQYWYEQERAAGRL